MIRGFSVGTLSPNSKFSQMYFLDGCYSCVGTFRSLNWDDQEQPCNQHLCQSSQKLGFKMSDWLKKNRSLKASVVKFLCLSRHKTCEIMSHLLSLIWFHFLQELFQNGFEGGSRCLSQCGFTGFLKSDWELPFLILVKISLPWTLSPAWWGGVNY